MKQLSSKNIPLNGSDANSKRAEILEYFLKTYELYEKLFDILHNDEAFYEQPERLRHPLIFYFGHTAVFYINKLVLAKKISRINDRFESIFAIGVDEMSWDDLNQTNYKWPSVNETREYRKSVKEALIQFIKTEPLSLPIGWNDPFWIVLMGIEHERIHLETSSVLIRQLDISKVKNSDLFKICDKSSSAPKNEFLTVPAGIVKLGKNHNDDKFYGWDNEYGYFERKLDEFLASKYIVTNGEFLEFVEAGGYENDQFWEEEGVSWKSYANAKKPPFWVDDKNGFKYRALSQIIDMPLDWPVDVNYHEAKAFCNWLSTKLNKPIRLPSEAEWHRLAGFAGIIDASVDNEDTKANINLLYASSTPVTQFVHGDYYDVVGNVWQWCETPIYGFEGFEIHPFYDDFSVPTFDGRHNIIKGGSFISTGNELLPSSRYAFRKHFVQHAGFRYVLSKNSIDKEKQIYETDELISQYLEFHYGEEYFGVKNFPAKIAEIAISVSDSNEQKRALDLGCSVGRASFELARVFDDVVGLDFSARFIRCAQELKTNGKLKFLLKTEGDRSESREIDIAEMDIEQEQRGRVKFWQADACNLKPIFTGFDLILAANLIDRLYAPEKFLSEIHERLNEGGVLVLTSPYSWSEDFTVKNDWLCSEEKSTLEVLRDILALNFEEIYEPIDVEFVIRESGRKYQHTLSQLTVWQKK
jgi:5-histidylcysteine sulfoxide synthase/putative 4-mercaptohistidine N1-methyltranferase